MRPTILYIEDDPVAVKLVHKMLKVMDYEVMESYDGREGLLTAIRHQPQLILLDLELNGMHGLYVVQQLKQHPATAHIPVIALTADNSSQMQSRCLDAGCDAFLNKPVSRTLLLKTVGQFLHENVA